jgi:DNA-binding transcriptional MerR regulator
MIRIGDFSKLSRISIRMLRHYDELGLLMPGSVDDFTGYRYYSEGQLPLAARIGALKDMGFSLAMIAEILKEYDNPEALGKFLALKFAEVKEQAEDANRRMLLLETTMNRLREDGSIMNYSVTLKEMPARTVASLRRVIPAYDSEGMLWQQMMQETAPLNLRMANPCHSVAVFHDEGYKESDVDVEIQITVEGSYRDTEHVIFKTVAPVQIASVTFQGGYDQLTAINEAIANWVNDNHYAFDGAMFNIYLVGPGTESNPDKWVTEVCYPVRKK